jgi:hypothetical protein
MIESQKRLRVARGASLFLRDLILLLLCFRASRVEAADDYAYQQVIITFDTSQDCTKDMFPSLWQTIIEEGLAEVGIYPQEWTRGYEIHDRGRRHVQSNAGCPDWCRYLTQYCECLCVSKCNGGDKPTGGGGNKGDDTDEDDKDNDEDDEENDGDNDNDSDSDNDNVESTNGNTATNNNAAQEGTGVNSNVNTNANVNANGNGATARPSERRLGETSWLDTRRRLPEAQFVVDEETVKSHIEYELQSSSLEIPCMRQQDGIRVYVITANG